MSKIISTYIFMIILKLLRAWYHSRLGCVWPRSPQTTTSCW